jgi:hypothetical protein
MKPGMSKYSIHEPCVKQNKKVLTEKAQREFTETAGRDSLTDWFCTLTNLTVARHNAGSYLLTFSGRTSSATQHNLGTITRIAFRDSGFVFQVVHRVSIIRHAAIPALFYL